MRNEIVRDGVAHGRYIISATRDENGGDDDGRCAICSHTYPTVTDYNGDAMCADCWVNHIDYCDRVHGTITEHWRGIGLTEHRNPRAHKAFMEGVRKGIFLAF